jgi:chaperonin cofactor prefoldin
MMRAMKKLLSSSEQGSSASDLTDQANAMKARSDALQQQEKKLKQQYGLMK